MQAASPGPAPPAGGRPHPARKRWLLDTSAWSPAPGELDWLCGLLPPEDAAAVGAYRREEDRKRSAAGRRGGWGAY
jgi:hypothetical protein